MIKSSFILNFFTFLDKKRYICLFMVEFQKKYQINKREIGLINWIGFWTLYKKEVLRFLAVWAQTLFSPMITSILFLFVLSLAIGNEKADVLGVTFINFLAPGLIAMQIIQQAFSHSSSSIMISKIQGNIVDMLYPPLSPLEVTSAVIFAAVTRSLMIAIVSILVFSFLIELEIKNYFYVVIFLVLSSFILGAAGFIAGLWAEKFDHMATVSNFFIVPLSFLSGTFYSIDKLPSFLQKISSINPFFYMIDGFRFGFIGSSDSSIMLGLIYLFLLSILFGVISYVLFKKGYKIKS